MAGSNHDTPSLMTARLAQIGWQRKVSKAAGGGGTSTVSPLMVEVILADTGGEIVQADLGHTFDEISAALSSGGGLLLHEADNGSFLVPLQVWLHDDMVEFTALSDAYSEDDPRGLWHFSITKDPTAADKCLCQTALSINMDDLADGGNEGSAPLVLDIPTPLSEKGQELEVGATFDEIKEAAVNANRTIFLRVDNALIMSPSQYVSIDNSVNFVIDTSTVSHTAILISPGAEVGKVFVRYEESKLSKSDIGLNNVTNDSQVKRTEMGAAGGVATLGEDGKVPQEQLPEFSLGTAKVEIVSELPGSPDESTVYIIRGS